MSSICDVSNKKINTQKGNGRRRWIYHELSTWKQRFWRNILVWFRMNNICVWCILCDVFFLCTCIFEVIIFCGATVIVSLVSISKCIMYSLNSLWLMSRPFSRFSQIHHSWYSLALLPFFPHFHHAWYAPPGVNDFREWKSTRYSTFFFG